LGDRLLAVIFDSLLLLGFFAWIGMWTASRWGGITPQGFSLEGSSALATIGLTLLLSFIYYWVMEGLFGATLGKWMVGIKVTSLTGGACGLRPSLIRNLLRAVDALFLYLVGFFIALFSRLRQRLGDHLARTVVIERDLGGFGRTVVVLLWLILLGGSLWQAYRWHSAATPPAQNNDASREISQMPAGTPGGVSSNTAATANVPAEQSRGGADKSGELRVSQFELLESKEGPVRTSTLYKSGEKAFARYRISGYGTDEQGKVNMQVHLNVQDPDGLTLLEWQGEFNQIYSAAEPPEGYFNFKLVNFAPPGRYQVQIKISDALKKTAAEYATSFQVEAPPPVAAKRLELRELILSLSEEGPPLDQAVIKSGDTLYTSAKLAGMQFDKTRIHCKLAFQLISPRGEVMLEKQDFLEIDDTYDYHPPGFFLNLNFHVNLPSPIPKGVYTEKYVVHDLIAKASETYNLKFTVR
jgi:uncharacterized RDD family membrane protein YckC